MRKYFLILLSIFIGSQALYSQQRDQEIRTTVSNLHINAFAQDKHGYLWIATARGLCRYNGYEYVHYFDIFGEKYHNNNMFDVYTDSKKDTWVLSGNCLARYDIVYNKFIPYHSPSPDYYYGLIEIKNQLYIYGQSGIFHVLRDQNKIIQVNSTKGLYDITTMTTDRKGNIWCGTGDGNGIFCLNSAFKYIRRYDIEDSYKNVNCSYIYSKDEIWFGTDHGIQIINQNQNPVTRRLLDFTSGLDVSVIKDFNDHTLLIGTKNKGVFLLDKRSFQLTVPVKKNLFKDVNSNHITCFYKGSNGDVWLGTFDKGVFKDSSKGNIFNTCYELNRFVGNRFITRIVEDKEGNIWMGTRYYGLLCYNPHTGVGLEYNQSNSPLFQKEMTNFVQSLMIDHLGRLWMGYGKSLCVCDIKNCRIGRYKIFNNTGDIVALAEDRQNRVWCGSSSNGLSFYDSQSDKLSTVIFQPGKSNNVTNINILENGDLIATVYSDQIYRINPISFKKKPLIYDKMLLDYVKSAIFVNTTIEKDVLWIGTYGRGMIRYDLRTKKYKTFLQEDGLCSNDVLSVCKDTLGNIWISTSLGLSRYSQNKGFINYYEYDGIGGNQFHEKCLLESAAKKIFFGGNHGLTYFDPLKVKISRNDVPVILENLKIYNQNVEISDKGVLSKQLSFMKEITLHHNQNVFSIDYCGIDFTAPEKIKYAYMLSGIDKTWNYVNDYRKASYSNLPPGEYIFRVTAQNKDGHWNKKPTELVICVKPAPWATIWAKMAYLILIIALVVAVIRFYANVQLNKGRLLLEKQENENEKQVLNMKINFFANISHELRTPLTMIYGPVKMLMKNSHSQVNMELLNLVNNNVERLLRLIDQLLDFTKLESDTLSLQVTSQDIMPSIINIMDSFSYYAKEKNIDLTLHAGFKELILPVDIDKLDKVLNNIVYNALKYSFEGGKVSVTVDVTTHPDSQFNIPQENRTEYLQISVDDNGVGMKEEDVSDLFNRYKRFDGKQDNMLQHIAGTGIGLHYVKKLIEKHKGQIIARAGDVKGMVFIFILPVDSVVYNEEESKVSMLQDFTDIESLNQDVEINEDLVQPDDENKKVILIVEDNPELRRFIGNLLVEDYTIIYAADGEEGFEKAVIHMPDIIVTDILMPKMNGYDMCTNIKNDPKTCHIPVIALTAKTTENDQIEGYSSGIDAYLNKPFNPKLLLTVISTLFENKERQRTLISNQPLSVENPDFQDEIKLNPLDQKFLDKLYIYIDKELSNCDLNVNTLGADLCFSRTSFYRKVKALTGQTPNDFLRIYRLNKAAELIIRGENSLSEICEITGFSSQSHFSTLFKKYFGVSPRDYKKTV